MKMKLHQVTDSLDDPPSINNQCQQHMTVSFLEVPKRCSRYLHEPVTVAAFVIENLFSASECHSILRLAEEFHYITEASHIDNDGT